MKTLTAIATVLTLAHSALAQGSSYTRPYTRKDGTYVEGHMRTAPNSTRLDNWSSQGGMNPYTGKRGTDSMADFTPPAPRTYAPRSQSAMGAPYVSPYTRGDGTRIETYRRSLPNSTKSDNFSTEGNINPNTWEMGSKHLTEDPLKLTPSRRKSARFAP